MPLTLECLSCNRKLGIPDKLRGQIVSCPACQAPIAVPSAPNSADSSSDVEDDTYRLVLNETPPDSAAAEAALAEVFAGDEPESEDEPTAVPPAPIHSIQNDLMGQVNQLAAELCGSEQHLKTLALLSVMAFSVVIPLAVFSDVNPWWLPLISASLTALFFTTAGLWWVFEKTGQSGWQAAVPVMNLLVLHQITGFPKWAVVGWLIPGLNLFVAAAVLYGLAKNFGYELGFALGLYFAAPAFFPFLGLSSRKYQNSWTIDRFLAE
jgi:hypothetical protein